MAGMMLKETRDRSLLRGTEIKRLFGAIFWRDRLSILPLLKLPAPTQTFLIPLKNKRSTMSLLAGIKSGKKKKRKDPPPSDDAPSINQHSIPKQARALTVVSANASVAEQLRKNLAAGESAPISEGLATFQDLERRGRIQQGNVSSEELKNTDSVVVHVMPTAKISSKDESKMTIQEMVAQERSQTMSTNEADARNIMRVGKKRKIKMKTIGADSDEEEHRQLQMMNSPGKKAEKAERRDQARQIARHDRQENITSRCWWWLESSTFARQRLLALGNHVSLAMAPSNLSLTPGQHLYIVPIKHVESLAACEDEVWDEVVRFQTSLRALYRQQGKDVLFCETVLPQSGFWQTKLEVIPVPRNVAQDAPLYFKTSLMEQAEEWGTHQKLMNTAEKGLRRTIPANFSYFYLEYDEGGKGYAQMIESSRFPKDFGVDTIAGMMEMDPIRFRRKEQTNAEEERQMILSFLDQWKKYDWTVDLDS